MVGRKCKLGCGSQLVKSEKAGNRGSLVGTTRCQAVGGHREIAEEIRPGVIRIVAGFPKEVVFDVVYVIEVKTEPQQVRAMAPGESVGDLIARLLRKCATVQEIRFSKRKTADAADDDLRRYALGRYRLP